jgi:hypothetical protein
MGRFGTLLSAHYELPGSTVVNMESGTLQRALERYFPVHRAQLLGFLMPWRTVRSLTAPVRGPSRVKLRGK